MSDIRTAIAAGNIVGALAALADHARSHHNAALLDEVTLLSARLSEVRRKEQHRLASTDELTIERNRLTAATTALLETYPHTETLAVAAQAHHTPQGFTESRFKRQLFYVMFGVKVAVLAWLSFNYLTSGFSTEQFAAAFAVLLPALATYTGQLYKEFINARYHEVDTSPAIRSGVRRFVYGMAACYALLLCFAVTAKAAWGVSFTSMTAAFAGIEALFGVYFSQTLTALFTPKA